MKDNTEVFFNILKSAKLALTELLDNAEKVNYNPPVPGEVVVNLESIIFSSQRELYYSLSSVSSWRDKMIEAGFELDYIDTFFITNKYVMG